jgi:hypothetical protein
MMYHLFCEKCYIKSNIFSPKHFDTNIISLPYIIIHVVSTHILSFFKTDDSKILSLYCSENEIYLHPFSFFVQRFINARRRIVQPMIDQSNRAGMA